ncbi:hypothetical protein [Staphylococcus aureus]|uniref:hypothetical protein n=1 Tax=Staphylococcus aureus TaxID=1280 RepID=UPI00177FFB2F|nr:hypothetical protein [Staphylococcus aureus]
MDQINSFIDWLTDASNSTGLKVVTFVGLIGLFVTLIMAIVKALSGKFKQASVWMGIFIFIAILMGSGYGILKAIGSGTGEDIENNVNMISILTTATAYGAYRSYNKLKQK